MENLKGSKKIALLGVLTALSTVANIFSIDIIPPYFSLTFTCTVTFLAGVFLGGLEGFAVGFIGDLLGGFIMPRGAYNPVIGVASGLTGLIPFIVFYFYDKIIGKERTLLGVTVCVIISFLLTTVICTSFLNTYALWSMYAKGKKSFWVYLSVRLPYQVTVTAINAVLSALLYFPIKKIFKIQAD